MTDMKVLWVRILIASTTFVVLAGTTFSYWQKRFGREYLYPGPIYTVLFVLAFLSLAKGVAYLSETLNKDRNYLKILTGILSFIIFVFTLFPQDQDTNPIIGWIIVIGLSFSSILISVFSTLEWVHKRIKWLLSFVFALISGIYGWIIVAFIQRGSNISEGGMGLIVFGFILFLISTIVNLIAVSSLKLKIGDEQ